MSFVYVCACVYEYEGKIQKKTEKLFRKCMQRLSAHRGSLNIISIRQRQQWSHKHTIVLKKENLWNIWSEYIHIYIHKKKFYVCEKRKKKSYLRSSKFPWNKFNKKVHLIHRKKIIIIQKQPLNFNIKYLLRIVVNTVYSIVCMYAQFCVGIWWTFDFPFMAAETVI